MRLGQGPFGFSWQIVPRLLIERMGDADRARAKHVMEAMVQMKRIDIAAIERAYRGGQWTLDAAPYRASAEMAL